MRVRWLAALLLFTLMGTVGLASPSPAGAVSCDPCPGVVLENLNLRQGPSTDDEILEVMPGGSAVTYNPATAADNGFRQITFDEQPGWASLDYLLLFPAAATTTDNLNLRDGDSTSDEILELMPAGSALTVLDVAENGFYSVEFEGTAGFAHGDYIDFDDAAPVAEFEVGDMVAAVGNLNLREGPSTGDDIIETLLDGAVMEVTGAPTAANGYTWYPVDAGTAGEGYVAGEFLELATEPVEFEVGDIVNTIDRLRLRDDSSLDGEVITTLDTGTSLEIIGGPVSADGYTWYQVDAGDDGEGWVAGEFLELAT